MISLLIKTFFVLLAGFVAGFVSADTFNSDLKTENNLIEIEAGGEANWLINDFAELDEQVYGTPKYPAGLEILPVENREVNEEHTEFTTLKDPHYFSFVRTETTGSIKITAKDLTAFDSVDSKDQATLESDFRSPDGKNFKVVLKELVPASYALNTLGGVATDILVHGHTGIGTSKIFPEFAYLIFWGFSDVYREGELISENRLTILMVSERYQEENIDEGPYQDYQPGLLQIHLVLVGSHKESSVHGPIPTGVISPNGEEQPFLHINFIENIKVKGNKFLSN